MSILNKIKQAFSHDKPVDHKTQEKEIQQNQTQKQVDKTLNDSFPASDPPGNY